MTTQNTILTLAVAILSISVFASDRRLESTCLVIGWVILILYTVHQFL